MKHILLTALLLLSVSSLAKAQLQVRVSPVKVTGEKAVVILQMRNAFTQPVESARAACFLLDGQGKMVGQATHWVIGGGGQDRSTLAPGATNIFKFVITPAKPLATRNLTAKVTFSRLVLEGGKVADAAKQVVITAGVK